MQIAAAASPDVHFFADPPVGGAVPQPTGDFDADCRTFSAFWLEGLDALSKLPAKPDRTDEQQSAAEAILQAGRLARRRFLGAHTVALYAHLTDGFTRKLRIEEIALNAAALVPGLTPDAAAIACENKYAQRDKDAHELDQGMLFNAILADRKCGRDLCHAMLLPKARSVELAPAFARDGHVDLGTAAIERSGKVATVWFKNPRFLHAEDDTTLPAVETAVDLALLDPETDIAILRGSTIEGGKYDGQRTACTGINLTHLYQGKISYLWYLIRDLGFINKIYRGVAYPDMSPSELDGESLEKPWIGAVENFAIGGGCQYLLVTDFVVAEETAYLTLPARKEGIVPGAANMRLPRFVGDRFARQAIQYERRIDCASPEGRMICDEVVPAAEFEQALHKVAHNLTNSGVVSAASNRRAFRIAQEPLDLFREYMAVYAREQAACHFSPALISNLERFWNAQNREA